MKKLNFIIGLTLILLFNSGCNKNDNNPVNNPEFSGKGSDYLPISAGQVVNGKVTGSVTEYDEQGHITDYTEATGQIYNATFGALTFIRNMNAYPVFANDEGENKLVGYLASNNNEISAFDNQSGSQSVVILPAELKINKEWVVNPQSPLNEQFKGKLVEALSSFTNSAGKTFENTISIAVTYHDSTGYYDGYLKRYIDGYIYLAKGIGLVGARVKNYEEIFSFDYYGTTYYKKTKASGDLGVID